MSANAASLYGLEYSTNVQLLLQQKGSKLADKCMRGSHKGDQASPVDQLAAIDAQQVTSRFAAIGRVDAAVDRRWVYPVDYDLNQLFDSFDALKVLSDPKSRYVENGTYAMGRAQDREFLTAIFGTAKTGVRGATSTSFLAGNVVGVNTGGTDSGMNVNKLRAGKKLLMGHQVDLDNDPIYCAITSKEHDELLNEIQIISADFNGADKPVLRDGKVERFLGINFVHVEMVATLLAGTDDQSGSSVAIPMWAKSGMYLGEWEAINANVDQRKDLKGLPWQAYIKGSFGATRLEEKKIVKIWCQA